MPATTKAELQAVTAREYDKLTKLIAPIDDATALRKREEETSIKDVIGHRAHWIALFLGWYRDGQTGKTVHFPAEGYKWNDLKRYNADLRAPGGSWLGRRPDPPCRKSRRPLRPDGRPLGRRSLWRADAGGQQQMDDRPLGRSRRPQPFPLGLQIHPRGPARGRSTRLRLLPSGGEGCNRRLSCVAGRCGMPSRVSRI